MCVKCFFFPLFNNKAFFTEKNRKKSEQQQRKRERERDCPEMRFKICWLKRTFTTPWFIYCFFFFVYLSKVAPSKSTWNCMFSRQCEYTGHGMAHYAAIIHFTLNFSPFWHNSVDIVNSSIIYFHPDKGVSLHDRKNTTAIKTSAPCDAKGSNFFYSVYMINWLMIESITQT